MGNPFFTMIRLFQYIAVEGMIKLEKHRSEKNGIAAEIFHEG